MGKFSAIKETAKTIYGKALTAKQNRARLAKIRKKEEPAQKRLKRIKDNKEAKRDDAGAANAYGTKKLTGQEKFAAKKLGINTKNKSPDSVRSSIENKMSDKMSSERASSYEPRFKKTGGSVKKKKVAKMNKGGMADYYKGMV